MSYLILGDFLGWIFLLWLTEERLRKHYLPVHGRPIMCCQNGWRKTIYHLSERTETGGGGWSSEGVQFHTGRATDTTRLSDVYCYLSFKKLQIPGFRGNNQEHEMPSIREVEGGIFHIFSYDFLAFSCGSPSCLRKPSREDVGVSVLNISCGLRLQGKWLKLFWITSPNSLSSVRRNAYRVCPVSRKSCIPSDAISPVEGPKFQNS